MSSLVIVAIPSEDDYVMKVSSEKIPHLTLLYLGEAGTADNLQQIIEFVEHASSLIQPFYMDVERRGILGDDDADVLFFEKGWDYKMVEKYRDQLKQNPAIKAAFNSAPQFPEWTPHLTLGYPETPANEPEEDRKLFSVRFDRIAVWDGDFKSMEFRLKNKPTNYELMMAAIPAGETALSHYGVKGMRWGVRNSGGASEGGSRGVGLSTTQKAGSVRDAVKGTRVGGAVANASPAARYDRKQGKLEKKYPSQPAEYRVQVTKKGDRKIETRGGKGVEPAPEAVQARLLNQQRKASGIQSLSNKQLQDLQTRLNLEQNVAKLTTQPTNGKVREFIKAQVFNAGIREKNIRNANELNAIIGGKVPFPKTMKR